MKTTLDQEDVELIAQRVAEMIKPLLSVPRIEDDPIFDIDGLAEYLVVKDTWVYQKIHTRGIPFFKVGKYPRFRKSQIDDWLQKTTKKTGKTDDTACSP